MIPLRTFMTSCRPLMAANAKTVKLPKQHEWNKTVSNAEKLVGFPTSAFHLRSLMNDETTSMGDHFRKLMGSDHPVLKTVKRLIIQGGQNNLQVRGLMMLLLSKAVNEINVHNLDKDDVESETGILGRQRQLAEVVEMITAGMQIHKSVMNLPKDYPTDKDSTDDVKQLEYGNKIAILSGDYLLANACVKLSELRDTYITEMIAVAIGEMSQSVFLGKQLDIHGAMIPSLENCSIEDWIKRNKMASATLLASGFKSSAILAKLSPKNGTDAHVMGENLALAIQAHCELQPFVTESSSDFDLSSGPVLFHLHSDPRLLNEIQNCDGDLNNVNKKKVFDDVLSSGKGIEIVRNICLEYSDKALKNINTLPDSNAKSFLTKLTTSLKFC